MNDRNKAMTILVRLDDVIQVDWNWMETYIKAIEKGLDDIRKTERVN